ncbi:hypothetical protein HID58_068322 [Brassica napus]|uniref:Uncharacterized protein n=1 Tax=Brassica napus TaxID=3708 RepID=A0ABQ7ZLK2_BRANA|nr:hypothetical protein HID58_068322 [Brassica napus]
MVSEKSVNNYKNAPHNVDPNSYDDDQGADPNSYFRNLSLSYFAAEPLRMCYKEVRFEALVRMVAPIFFAAVQEGAATAKLPRQTSSCFGRELI